MTIKVKKLWLTALILLLCASMVAFARITFKAFAKGSTTDIPLIVLNNADGFETTYGKSAMEWQGIPSIAVTEKGRLWGAYFTGGEGEPDNDNYVVYAYSDDGGETWTDPFFVVALDSVADPNVRAYDPNVWIDPNGKLWFFWTQGYDGYGGLQNWAFAIDNPDASVSALRTAISGATPTIQSTGVKINAPIVLANGNWMFFTARQTPYCIDVWQSSDGGASWENISIIDNSSDTTIKITEPMGVQLDNGNIEVYVRIDDNNTSSTHNDQGGLGKFVSTDNGATWSSISYNLGSPLTTPESKFIMKKLKSGNLLLVTDADTYNRKELTAYLSVDDGETWAYSLELEPVRAFVAYPDVAEDDYGNIYVIYDKGRDRTSTYENNNEIRLTKITEEDIKAGFVCSESSKEKILISAFDKKTKDIESVTKEFDRFTYLELGSGVSKASIISGLPTSITVVADDGNSYVISGSWSNSDYDGNVAGKYLFKFSLTSGDLSGLSNANTNGLFDAHNLLQAVVIVSSESSYNIVNNVNNTTYNKLHYTSFDALSVNFPTTVASEIVTLKFPVGSVSTTATNAAIRLRIQTVVPITGKEGLRIDILNAAGTAVYLTNGATLYKVQNGVTTTTNAGSNQSANIIDTAEVNGAKAFNGYVIIPISAYASNPSTISAVQVRTNGQYAKTVWNFGDIDIGTYSGSTFTKTSTIWSAFDENGNANKYSATAQATGPVYATLLKAGSSVASAPKYTESTYNTNNISNFNALSINIPNDQANTGAQNIVSFEFNETDMTGDNAAIRIRLQTLVQKTGRMNPQFLLVQGSTSTTLTNGEYAYKIKNGVAAASTIGSTSIYILDNGANGTNERDYSNGLFDGYIIIPLSCYNVTASAVTGLTVKANPYYIKNIWNFGDIDYGTFDGETFVKTANLWTTSGSYTVGDGIDSEIVSGTSQNLWMNVKLDNDLSNTASISIANYDGIKIKVDNSENASRSFQLYMWDVNNSANLGSSGYGWMAKNGLAYFIPDNDCAAFANSSAFRSSFIPAGFKGTMYVPFTLNTDGYSGAWQRNNSATTTFPTRICNLLYVYTTINGTAFYMGTPELVQNDNSLMAQAFETTSSVNLSLDYDTALMIKTADTVSSRFELQPGNSGNVPFSTVTVSNNQVTSITGGSALAVAIENPNSEAFKFKVSVYNQNTDIIELGGNIVNGKALFTYTDGTTEYFDIDSGYVTIPAYAKGTLTLSYVGGKDISTNTTYKLGYPVNKIYRLWLDTQKVTSATMSVKYIIGQIAVVDGNGTATVLTVGGTDVATRAAQDVANSYIARSNIAYHGEVIALDALNPNNYYYAGASIRVVNDGQDGIRFTVRIEKEIYDILTEQEPDAIFGMLVIPEDMKGGELTVDTAYVVNRTANHILTEETVDGKEYLSWTFYMYGVPKTSWGRGFLSRGYILVDGEYYYTEESFARSINYVAQAVYDAYLAGDDTFADRIDQIMVYLPE